MKKLLEIVGITILMIVITSCEKDLYPSDNGYELVTFWNGSPYDVGMVMTFNYPDTCLPDYGVGNYCGFMSLSSEDAMTYRSEYTRDEILSLNEVIQVFVVKEENMDIWEKNGGKYMCDNKLILKRYEFTHAELAALDWVVMYPERQM